MSAGFGDITEVLRRAGIENADREARWLLEAAEEDEESALELARRRAGGEPLQYVTGTAAFRHIEVAVGPGVLIPRPETEVVTERALGLLPVGGTAVDIGTGSGAIALSIASERNDVTVFATELTGEAFVWAEKNRRAMRSPIKLLQGDLFSPLPETLRGQVDVVVSNPPYVSLGERALLPRDVIDFEPYEALFADDGLSVLRRLIAESPDWLKPGGWIVLEIGETQGDDVLKLLSEAGFVGAFVEQDLTGRDRIAGACRK